MTRASVRRGCWMVLSAGLGTHQGRHTKPSNSDRDCAGCWVPQLQAPPSAEANRSTGTRACSFDVELRGSRAACGCGRSMAGPIPTLSTLATLRASPMSKSNTVLNPVSSITRIRSSSGSDTAHAEPGRSISSTTACSPKAAGDAVSPRRALRLKPGNAANASGLSGVGVGATTGPHVPRAQSTVPTPPPAPADFCGVETCCPADAASSLGISLRCCVWGAQGDALLLPLPPPLPVPLLSAVECGAAPKADTPKGTALPAPNAHGSAKPAGAAPPAPGAVVGGCGKGAACAKGCAVAW